MPSEQKTSTLANATKKNVLALDLDGVLLFKLYHEHEIESIFYRATYDKGYREDLEVCIPNDVNKATDLEFEEYNPLTQSMRTIVAPNYRKIAETLNTFASLGGEIAILSNRQDNYALDPIKHILEAAVRENVDISAIKKITFAALPQIKKTPATSDDPQGSARLEIKGIGDTVTVIEKNMVFTARKGPDKNSRLTKLAEHFNLSKEQVILVDDCGLNISPARKDGFKTIFIASQDRLTYMEQKPSDFERHAFNAVEALQKIVIDQRPKLVKAKAFGIAPAMKANSVFFSPTSEKISTEKAQESKPYGRSIKV